VLHHHGADRHLVAMAIISNLECDEAASAQLAFEARIEERELSSAPVAGAKTASPCASRPAHAGVLAASRSNVLADALGNSDSLDPACAARSRRASAS